MVTSFSCSCVDGRGAAQSPSRWRSCKVWGKMGEGGVDDTGIIMEVEGAWNLAGMGMLSCMRVDIGVLVCVLVLVVVLVLVLMWMVLTVWVVVGVLAVLLAMVVATMVRILVEFGCVGVVFESSGRGFVVVVVVVEEDFGVVLWCGWRMALWCWNERGDFL